MAPGQPPPAELSAGLPAGLAELAKLAQRMREQLDVGPLNACLDHLSRRKAKHRRVAFFGRDRFADNAKYLFLHCAERRGAEGQAFDAVWCSFNTALVEQLNAQGLPAFDLGADATRSLALLLSTAVAVHCVNPLESLRDESFLAALAGAQQVQLWHGVSLKHFKHIDLMLLDHPQPPALTLAQARMVRWASSVDIVVSPAARYDPLWQRGFGVHRVIRAGLPRNEVLLRPATALEQIDAIPPPAPQPGLRILWAPTFSLAERGPSWADHGLAAAILGAAADRNPVLFVKPHPFDVRNHIDRGFRPAPGVHLLPGEQDVYPALHSFDVLITDRSSLLSDFLLLDRPVLLFDPNGEGDPTKLIGFDVPDPGPVATRDDVGPVLRDMLRADRFGAARAANRAAAFETDPATACRDIRAVLSRLVDAAAAPVPVQVL